MSMYNELCSILRNRVEVNAPLSKVSYWRIGGTVEYLVRPTCTMELKLVLKVVRSQGFPFVVIGKGTNILFPDGKLSAVLIVLGAEYSDISINCDTGEVVAQAGAWMPCVARNLANQGLSGAEHLVGIPGSLGGIVVMNGGSNRQSISENILSVRSITPDGVIISRSKEQCEFGYRTSCFQSSDEIVIDVEMVFSPRATKEVVRSSMLNILKTRRMKFPLNYPSCGSVFMADKVQFSKHGAPGKVLEGLGLKGVTIGGAQISKTHANFMVNMGGATALDILQLVKLSIKRAAEFGIDYNLLSEIKYVSQEGHIMPLHQAALSLA